MSGAVGCSPELAMCWLRPLPRSVPGSGWLLALDAPHVACRAEGSRALIAGFHGDLDSNGGLAALS